MDETEKEPGRRSAAQRLWLIPAENGQTSWRPLLEPFAMDLTKSDLDEAHRLGLKVVAWVAGAGRHGIQLCAD